MPRTEFTKNKHKLVVALEPYDGKYHGITHWLKAWDPTQREFARHSKQKSITIQLGMKLKPHLSVAQRVIEYYSTLIHELGHGLGIMHFKQHQRYAEEIMTVGRGGTLVPDISHFSVDQQNAIDPRELELPEFKASPFTRDLLRWLYLNPNPRRVPLYCDVCKSLRYAEEE